MDDPLTYLLNKENLDCNDENSSEKSTPSCFRSVSSLSPRSIKSISSLSPRSTKSISPYSKYGDKFRSLFGYEDSSKVESPIALPIASPTESPNESPSESQSESQSESPNEGSQNNEGSPTLAESESPFMLWPIELGAAPALNTIATSPFNIVEAKSVEDISAVIASPIMKVVHSKKFGNESKRNAISPFKKLMNKPSYTNVLTMIKIVIAYSICFYLSTILKDLIEKPLQETHSILSEVHELRIDVNDELNIMSGKVIHVAIDLLANQLNTVVVDDDENRQSSEPNFEVDVKEEEQKVFLPINTINPDWKDSSFESIFINFS